MLRVNTIMSLINSCRADRSVLLVQCLAYTRKSCNFFYQAREKAVGD